MIFIFIYIWTMFSTSVIALYDGNDCQKGIYVPGWLKVVLILPVKKEKKIPLYIIVIHSIIQILTVFFVISLLFHEDANHTFRIYGMILVYGCISCALILQRLYEKRHHNRYGDSVEHSYCLKYHIKDSKSVNILYHQKIDEYEMAILWDGEYLSYCLLKIKSTRHGAKYRMYDTFRLQKRMLCFEKKVVEDRSAERWELGTDSSTKYFADTLIKKFYGSNKVFAKKGFPYVGASCNQNIDKLEIGVGNVKISEEKKIGEWVFYIWKAEKSI